MSYVIRGQRRILVVEDEALIAEEIIQRLGRRGAEMQGPVDTADEAFTAAAEGRPDLVLMDIRLKGAQDGIEAATRIYDELDIPIVFLTANADEATFQRARTPAQYGYVVKPFIERDLLMAIDLALHRHRIEHELRKSNITHAAIAACLSDGIVALGADRRVRYMNAAAEALTGWRATDALGRHVDAVVDAAEEVIAPISRPGAAPATREVLLRPRTGETVPVQIASSSLVDGGGRAVGVALTLHDLRGAREAEAALRHSEARFRSAFEGAGIGMAIHSTDGRHVRVNAALCEMLGYTEAELLERKAEDITLPEDVPELRASLRAVIRGERRAAHFEKRLVDARGRTRWVAVSMSLVDAEAGHEVITQLEDIDDRKRLVADLTATNERYARFQAALLSLTTEPAGASDRSPDERLASWLRLLTETVAAATNAARVAVLHFTDRGTLEVADAFTREPGTHATGTRFTKEERPDLFEATCDGAGTCRVDPAAQGASAHAPVWSGGKRIGLICASREPPVPWTGDERHFLVSIANIAAARCADAERERIEVKLRETEKMSAIGKLAGGIAHDFNNLLTVISASGDMLLSELSVEGEEARACVTSILEAVDRAGTLTRQLLLFARGTPQAAKTLQPNDVIDALTQMLRRVLKDSVTLSVRLSPELRQTRIDVVHLEQVLMNLIVNAGDAMPNGGRLEVVTRNRSQRDAADAAPPGLAVEGPFVQICVRDDGIGISPEVLPRIFEPFFSTKVAGKGTGLGLATVYGIIGQAGGFVTVESKVGAGSTFEVWIPAVLDADRANRPTPLMPGTSSPSARVLLVEDDAQVRRAAGRLLRMLGHDVQEATSAREAIGRLERAEDRFDLLITDMSMPGMTGLELVEKVRTQWPQVRVLMMSGYHEEAAAVRDSAVRLRTAPLLHKPFSVETLSRAVTAALAGDDRPTPLVDGAELAAPRDVRPLAP